VRFAKLGVMCQICCLLRKAWLPIWVEIRFTEALRDKSHGPNDLYIKTGQL
jgi:hypothetical protein